MKKKTCWLHGTCTKKRNSTVKWKLLEKRRESKNKTEQLRYHRLRHSEDVLVSENENQSLQNQLKELEKGYDNLKFDLDEIMNDKEISTFEGGQYKADLRVVCYELISRGVGSRHVSEIIRLVLNWVAGLNCGRLPKPTLIRMMALEQALLAKESAKSAIENSTSPVTLQLDGTTKNISHMWLHWQQQKQEHMVLACANYMLPSNWWQFDTIEGSWKKVHRKKAILGITGMCIYFNHASINNWSYVLLNVIPFLVQNLIYS